jgi:transposase-like protein
MEPEVDHGEAKFTREFKLEAVRLIRGSRGLVCAGIRRPEGASDAAA